MDMQKLLTDSQTYVEQMSEEEIKESINNAVEHCNTWKWAQESDSKTFDELGYVSWAKSATEVSSRCGEWLRDLGKHVV